MALINMFTVPAITVQQINIHQININSQHHSLVQLEEDGLLPRVNSLGPPCPATPERRAEGQCPKAGKRIGRAPKKWHLGRSEQKWHLGLASSFLEVQQVLFGSSALVFGAQGIHLPPQATSQSLYLKQRSPITRPNQRHHHHRRPTARSTARSIARSTSDVTRAPLARGDLCDAKGEDAPPDPRFG